MKKLILLLLICAGLGANAPQALAQTTSKIVVVRMFESPVAKRMFISYPDGKTEEQELASLTGRKDQKANTEQLQQVISRLYSEGYTLINTFTGGVADYPANTMVFRKD